MLAQESYVNQSEGHRYGDTELYETNTDDVGELYRAYQAEYGRCESKIYIDTDDGVKAVGWVFLARVGYEDSHDTYLREVWVTLYDAEDTVKRTHHYHYIAS